MARLVVTTHGGEAFTLAVPDGMSDRRYDFKVSPGEWLNLRGKDGAMLTVYSNNVLAIEFVPDA